MRTLFTCLLGVIVSLSISAQNIDVTDVYFTEPSGTTPIPDTSLEPGSTVTLWFTFQNNLNDTIKVGDSLTFAWEKDNVFESTLIMDSLNNTMAPGASINAYLVNNYTIPTSAGGFEVCCWPLYNPYNPNTDPMVGRHCKSSFSVADTTTPPDTNDPVGTVTQLGQNKNMFYVSGRSIYFNNNQYTGNTTINLIDITGAVVMEKQVSTSGGRIDVPQEVSPGIYIVSVRTKDEQIVEKVLIH